MLAQLVAEINSHVLAIQQMQSGLMVRLQPIVGQLTVKLQSLEAEVEKLKRKEE